MMATAKWTIERDEEDNTWNVLKDGEIQDSYFESRVDAFKAMKAMRDDEIASDLKDEINDLTYDLGGQDLAKLREILKILKA